jgi:hypothetical protein
VSRTPAYLADRMNNLRLKAAALQGRADGAVEAAKNMRDILAEDEYDQEVLEAVVGVLTAMSAAWRKHFEESLTLMVSRGLTLVLGEPMRFIVESKARGNGIGVEFKLEQDGLETDILEAKGGTVVNLVNFLLRLAVVLATHPPLRRIVVLDEAFAHVSAEYVPALASLLRTLCDETGVQFLLVTHEPAYGDAADVVYEVTQANRVSTFTRVKSKQEG